MSAKDKGCQYCNDEAKKLQERMSKTGLDGVDKVLIAALSAGHTQRQATARLLQAISTNEGGSDLGLLAYSILHSGPYLVCISQDSLECAQTDAENIPIHAEAIYEEISAGIEWELDQINGIID